jgi:Sigma-70 region 2
MSVVMRLSDEFEERRDYLRNLALGILGSRSDADDAVQETWLRFARCDAGAIDNPTGWLTTVTSRVSLDILRARRARPATQLSAEVAESTPSLADDPEREVLMADTIGTALAVLHERFVRQNDSRSYYTTCLPSRLKTLRRFWAARLPPPNSWRVEHVRRSRGHRKKWTNARQPEPRLSRRFSRHRDGATSTRGM